MKSQAQNAGFTLIEVLVAGLVMLLMVLATTALMRHGQQVAALDHQRNLARHAMVTELEKSQYDHARFDSLQASNSTYSFTLDNRDTPETSDDLQGTLRIQVDSANILVNSHTIPRKRVSATTYWNSLDGSDTLSMEIWICKILL